jgi:hypothetical protein
MSPARQAKIISFPGAQKPVQGLPDFVPYKEDRAARTPPIVKIDGQPRADRALMKVLLKTGITVSALNADHQIISVIVELPARGQPDPLIIFADLSIEIAGEEELFTKCEVVDIEVWERFVEILIKPSPAYVLNWNEGTDHSLPAVCWVKAYNNYGNVLLFNQFHSEGVILRTGSRTPAR